MNSLLSERGRSVASLFISVRWLPLSSISLKADYGDDEKREGDGGWSQVFFLLSLPPLSAE